MGAFDPASFMNPGLLWLAVGAAAPIIIHLAARSRPKPTPFPALRFIRASHRRSSARFKVKQLLLLLLRIAAMLLFAFILARPWVEGASADARQAKATVTAVFLLDTSYSMGYEVEPGMTALDRAKEMALAAVDQFTVGDSRVCLLLVEDAPREVIHDFDHAYDLAELREQIQDAPLSFRRTDCSAAVSKAVALLEDVEGVGRSIFLFTDLTRNGWPAAVPPIEGTEDISLYVGDAGHTEPANPAALGVDPVRDAAPGAPVEVTARVDTRGMRGKREAGLVIDGAEPVKVEAEGLTEVTFKAAVGQAASEHWGEVVLDVPNSRLPVDDRFAFTFRTTAARRLLLVNGAPSPVPRLDEAYFLRAALPPTEVVPGQLFRVTEVRPAELGSYGLAGVDVIAFCNVGTISRGAWNKVRHFVATGGGLIVFAGDQVTAEAYAYAGRGEKAFLPCAVGEPVDPDPYTRLEPGRLRHEILHIFRGGRNGDLASGRFSRYLALRPGEGAEVVIRFTSGDPAMVAGTHSAGRVLVFASTCDTDWTTLPGEAPYPVLVQQSLKYLAGTAQTSRDVAVGSPVSLPIPEPVAVGKIVFRRVGAGTAQDVTGRLAEGRLNLGIVGRPGVYEVEVQRPEGRGADRLYFAANVDTAESDLARFETADELASLVKGRSVEVASTRAELLDAFCGSEVRAELTSHFAGVMLAVLLAEMWLSNHMRSRVQAGEGQE
ncbi:MAG: BatA domain-containing protein [Planctomycetota bacterium]